MICCDNRTDKIKDLPPSIELLNEKIIKLKNENETLKKNLEISKTEWSDNIDKFVDNWHEENKDNVDIGVIDFKLFKIDLFPDKLEKYIYKKILKILYSFLTSMVTP